MEFERLPEEFAMPPAEKATMAEANDPRTIEEKPVLEKAMPGSLEFEGKSGGEDGAAADNHRLLKRLFLMPVASTMTALAIVFASFGYDPLGDDFLAHEYHEAGEEPGEPQQESGSQKPKGDGGQDKPASEPEEGKPMRQYPGDLTDAVIHVYYVPTEESAVMTEKGDAGLKEAKKWVKDQGGDPDSLVYVSSDVHTVKTADGPFVGDIDDLDHAYDPFGSIHETQELHVYYNAYASVTDVPEEFLEDPGQEEISEEEPFPELSNLEPDFTGEYGGSNRYGYGILSEEFIRIDLDGSGELVYLVAGDAWGGALQSVDGAYYDADANVLTLDHFSGEMIDVNLMGNGFTVELVGENYVNQIQIWGYGYGGSVRFTGSGKLVINDHYASASGGLLLRAEASESCIMVDGDVDLEIYGNPAIMILETRMEDAIYYHANLEPAGLVEAYDDWTDQNEFQLMAHNYVFLGEDGSVASYVHFTPKD